MTGLCGACGDQLHAQPCERQGCECQQGIRTDLFACMMLGQISRQLHVVSQQLEKFMREQTKPGDEKPLLFVPR